MPLGFNWERLALVVAVACLLLPLARSGLWAPYELEVADLSRRIALNLYHAPLSLPGADNSVPILSDLGKGELPFCLIAAGLSVFGLRDWAGRVPLLLVALGGLFALFWLLRRLAGNVSASIAVLILATSPLYFVQAHALLGDGVTLAAAAAALGGLGLAVLDPALSRRGRFGAAALGVLGLAAGLACRGALLGVAPSALAIGLTAAVLDQGPQRLAAGPRWLGRTCLVLGLAAVGVSVWALVRAKPDLYLEVMGAQWQPARRLPTHDTLLHRVGFGFFPWSAVAPLALVVALRRGFERTAPESTPPESTAPERTGLDWAGPEQALRVALALAVILAGAAHGAVAPYQADIPFVGLPALAALVALAFRDLETEARGTRLFGLGGAALLVALALDLERTPAQSLWAFDVVGATFPENSDAAGKHYFLLSSAAGVAAWVLALGAWAPTRKHAAWTEIRGFRRRLRHTLGRHALPVLGLLTLVLTLLSAAVLIDSRVKAFIPWPGLVAAFRGPLFYAFLLPPLVVLGPCGVWLLRDGLGWLLRSTKQPPARLGFLALALLGCAGCLRYYPALRAELSPRSVFSAFTDFSKPGDSLAVMGKAARAAPFYTAAAVQTPGSPAEANSWLLENAATDRRWLVIDSAELPAANQRYRKIMAKNLSILDVSSEALLLSSQLLPGEVNVNPLEPWVSSTAPTVQHPLTVELEGKLRCLGYSITDSNGNPVASPAVGQPYQFRIHWQVLGPVDRTWKVFIHLDGAGKRFNGDHDPVRGKYPTNLWLPGDFVTDSHPIQLDAQFRMDLDVYFGLFIGDRRLKVTLGEHHEDRIRGGVIKVR
jgi:4-amino-4-deoxy-L-arabinose transferase-like glycosyltransferase